MLIYVLSTCLFNGRNHEYVFFTQTDVEMPIPKYFINERAKALKEREKLLATILAKLGPQDKESVNIQSNIPLYLVMTLPWKNV